MVFRHAFAKVPSRVEYELTETGQGMLPAMNSFMEWVRRSWPFIRALRANPSTRNTSRRPAAVRLVAIARRRHRRPMRPAK